MGKFCKMITTIDTHTGGQPTRTIVAGLPRLYGKDLSEKMLYMKEHEDWVRTFFTSEPRGTKITSVAVLTEPTRPDADAAAFFFESHGYMPMCGHDTIGLCTALVETGTVNVTQPVTRINLETPNGMIYADVEVQEGKAKSVTFENAPCFAFGTDMTIEFEGNTIKFDVGYGGNFYAIIPASDVGLVIAPENYHAIIEKANKLIKIINSQYNIVHPEKNYLKGVTHIQFTNPVERKGNILYSKNAVIYQPGDIDRSPCGTGTSARSAVLYSKGEFKPGQTLEHRSIIDSLFKVTIAQELEYCGYRAIIPRVTGNAFLTGKHTWLLDPEDDKGFGFTLGR